MGYKANKSNIKTYSTIRTFMQIGSLLVFAVLLHQQREQFWFMLFLVLGIGASMFMGRAYCGWICPMGTLLRFQTFIYKKIGIRRIQYHQTRGKHLARWIILVTIVVLLIAARRQGVHFPLLLYMSAAAVLVSFFLEEPFWHRTACPFGTLLSVSSKPARRTIAIEKDGCIACGKCEKVCPSHSITEDESGKRQNKSEECLLCRTCISVCPTGVISYGAKKNTQ